MPRTLPMSHRTIVDLLKLEDRCAPGEVLQSLAMPGGLPQPLDGDALVNEFRRGVLPVAGGTLDRFLPAADDLDPLLKPKAAAFAFSPPANLPLPQVFSRAGHLTGVGPSVSVTAPPAAASLPGPLAAAPLRAAPAAALPESPAPQPGVARPADSPTVPQSFVEIDSNRNEAQPAPERLAYNTADKSIGLLARPDRIAVELAAPSDAAVAALTQRGGPFEGLSLQRWLNDRAVVLEGASAAERLNGPLPGGVTAVVPVFINRWGGRDAVVFRDVIVALKPGVSAEEFFRNEPVAEYRPLWGTPDQFVATLAAGAGHDAVDQANQWNDDPRTVWSEPDFYSDIQTQSYFPNDPRLLGANLWHLWNFGQYGGVADADVDMEHAWGINPGGSPNLIISVVDDGVETGHPDLNPWFNPNESKNGVDSDSNGYIDDINGWNFVSNNNNASFTSNLDRHGTAVAGVAAAKGDNGIGVVGPSYKAQVMSSRIFEDGKTASNSNVASALYYATGRNKSGVGHFAQVDVMNNSWGGGGYSSAITDAFNYATTHGRGGLGTIVVVAAANDFASTLAFPAFLAGTNPGLISVGGSNNKDTRANYSNFGHSLDLVAPTADTRSNYLWIDTTDRVGAPGYNETDYTGIGVLSFGGTSASAPLVAGIAGLVLSQAESKGIQLTAKQVKDLLKNSTDLLPFSDFTPPMYDPITGNSVEFGRGRINAFTAVSGVGKPELSVLSMSAELQNNGNYSLGTAPVGGSTTHTLRIRNTGTSPLLLGDPQITTGGADFAVDSAFGSTTLLLGESTTLSIRFAPQATGPAAGTITFTSNDADDSPFVLNLGGTGIAANVAGRVFEDWNGNGTADANDPGLAGRTVFLDANGNGTLDRVSFNNTSQLLIPDKFLAGVTSSILVNGQSAPVSGLTVGVDITHPYIGDLALYLIAPSGKRLLLFSGIGESSANLSGTVFSDTAAVNIAQSAGPFTGSFRPQFTPLSYFNGEDPNGEWKLLAIDYFAGDIGTLDGWSLEFNAERTTVTDGTGRFAFAGVPNGSYHVRTITPDGWTATGPASFPVTIASPAESFAGFEFGSAKNNRAYLRVFNDANADGTFDPGEAGVPGRVAFHDVNLDGIRTIAPPPATFTKSAALAIPDNSGGGVLSFLSVAGVSGKIVDLEVSINVAHAAVGDLRFKLVSPSGASSILVDQRGSNGVNFKSTTFTDSATASAAAMLNYQAPFSGRYQPETPLSVMKGTAPNGAWILQSFDLKNGTSGVLVDWTLRITTQISEPAMASLPGGNAWLDLPPGSQELRVEPLAGWKFTSPPDGTLVVNAAGAPIFEQTLGTAEAVPPTVLLPIAVNGGAAQRSQVTSVRVDFSEEVQFDGDPATAFALSGPGGSVPLTAIAEVIDGKTRVSLAIAPPFLPDGKYTLTVDHAKIADLAQNPLEPVAPQNFHRLYADFNGDATVDSTDFAVFGSAFGSSLGDPNYVPEADANGDNTIDAIDFAELGARFGISI